MLKFPDDPRCIVSIHYYLPPEFAVAEPRAAGPAREMSTPGNGPE